jgi:hypothetical protein
MRWGWCGKTAVVVFSTYIVRGVFRVRVMTGPDQNKLTPSTKPALKGTVTNCISHDDAFRAARAWFEKKQKNNSL